MLSHGFKVLNDFPGHRLGAAVELATIIRIEQRIFNTGIASPPAALDYSRVLCHIGTAYRDAADRTRLVAAGARIVHLMA
jgi:hypothetical protein